MSCSILKLLPHSPVQDNSVYKKTRSELRKPEVNKIVVVPANKAVTSEKNSEQTQASTPPPVLQPHALPYAQQRIPSALTLATFAT